MTFVGVLVTVKRMPISIDPQNADPGVFYGESSLRISHSLWLLSANVPQVGMLPQKPGPQIPRSSVLAVSRGRDELLQSLSSAPKYSLTLNEEESFPSQNTISPRRKHAFTRKKKSLANFPALKTPHSGQGGSVVGKGHI